MHVYSIMWIICCAGTDFWVLSADLRLLLKSIFSRRSDRRANTVWHNSRCIFGWFAPWLLQDLRIQNVWANSSGLSWCRMRASWKGLFQQRIQMNVKVAWHLLSSERYFVCCFCAWLRGNKHSVASFVFVLALYWPPIKVDCCNKEGRRFRAMASCSAESVIASWPSKSESVRAIRISLACVRLLHFCLKHVCSIRRDCSIESPHVSLNCWKATEPLSLSLP